MSSPGKVSDLEVARAAQQMITAADYDFTIEDTANGGGVRVQGDQPITRLNIFSVDRVQSVEPYIAIDLAPGEEKRWSHLHVQCQDALNRACLSTYDLC